MKTKIHRLIFTSGRGSMSMPGSRAGSPTGCGSGTPISSTGSAARPTRQSQGPFPRGTGGFRRVVLQQHSLGNNNLFFNYGFLRANCEINKFKRPEVGIYKRNQELDLESDQENKNSAKKKRKNFIFFLDHFLGRVLVFFVFVLSSFL